MHIIHVPSLCFLMLFFFVYFSPSVKSVCILRHLSLSLSLSWMLTLYVNEIDDILKQCHMITTLLPTLYLHYDCVQHDYIRFCACSKC